MAEYLAFAGRHPFLIGGAIALVIIILVSELRRARRPWRDIGALEAVRLINAGAQLIDVRGPDAFRAGHIINARNIPASDIADRSDKLDRAKPVVVYCDSGLTSGRAASILADQGFAQVWNLHGGLAAWKRENMPVAKS